MIGKRCVLATAWVLTIAVAPSHAATVWVEAESAQHQTTHRNPWWDAVRTSGLSGGAMVASFSEPNQETGTASLTFTIPQAGTYGLWLRLASGGTGYEYQLDDRPQVSLDVKTIRRADNDNRRQRGYKPRLRDERNLAIDGTTDARYYAWVRAAQIELRSGQHTLRFWLGGKEAEKRFGAVDAVVLTTEDFEPNGPYKPGEVNPNEVTYDEAEMWTFQPERDPLSDEALFDLRYLNEKVAGEHGFIRRSADGMSFVRGDGQPLRF